MTGNGQTSKVQRIENSLQQNKTKKIHLKKEKMIGNGQTSKIQRIENSLQQNKTKKIH